MCRLCRGLIYHALVVLAGLLMMGGSCDYDGDRDVPDPRAPRRGADYTKIHPADMRNYGGDNYSDIRFYYPKCEYMADRAIQQHINLVFVEIPEHVNVINSWYSGNEIAAIKSSNRFSGYWSYENVYMESRTIPVNSLTISANVPSNPDFRQLLRVNEDGEYYFRTTRDAFIYYAQDVVRGSVMMDLEIDSVDSWRYVHAWTNYIIFSPAYIEARSDMIGVTEQVPVGRHNGDIELVSYGYSIIFLGALKRYVDEGYRTFIEHGFREGDFGSFDFVMPESRAFVGRAQLTVQHESIHAFQQKMYARDSLHCETVSCVMRYPSGLKSRVTVINVSTSDTTYHLATRYSTLDFNGITLRRSSDCWRHRLSGNVFAWGIWNGQTRAIAVVLNR